MKTLYFYLLRPLKQSKKIEKSGKTWTAIASGMLVGGKVKYD